MAKIAFEAVDKPAPVGRPPSGKVRMTLRVDADVADFYRKFEGHLQVMNDALRRQMQSLKARL